MMRLLEGQSVPKGYGFAWTCWDRPMFVVYPIPFNILLGGVRRLWIKALRFGVESDPAVRAYQRGWDDARTQFSRHPGISHTAHWESSYVDELRQDAETRQRGD